MSLSPLYPVLISDLHVSTNARPSTRVSSGFGQPRNSSPSFGSQRTRSHSRHIHARWSLRPNVWFNPDRNGVTTFTFVSHSQIELVALACTLNSLVRVKTGRSWTIISVTTGELGLPPQNDPKTIQRSPPLALTQLFSPKTKRAKTSGRDDPGTPRDLGRYPAKRLLLILKKLARKSDEYLTTRGVNPQLPGIQLLLQQSSLLLSLARPAV